jgi:colanic acid/amylovoran biosynthesis protein
MVKIVIVNCWHDSNKGDSAIVWGTLKSFAQRYPDASFSLFSMFSSKDPRYQDGFRHIKKAFTDVRTFPSMIANEWEFSWNVPCRLNSIARKVWWAAQLFHSFNSLCVSSLIKSKEEVTALLEADVIISSGGHYFAAPRGSIGDLARLYFHAYPLLLAYRFEKPFVIYAQSVGPFEGIVPRRFIASLFSRAAFIGVREALSKEELIRCGVPANRVNVIPDAAFAMEPRFSNDVQSIMENHGLRTAKFVVMTVRQWFRRNDPRYHAYIGALAQVGQYFLKMDYKVAVVVHTLGPTPPEDDRIVSLDLFERLANYKQDCSVLIQEDLSPPELAALYGKAKILIGTRFHSIIFALIGGTPVYALSYFGPKAFGIMKMLGLEEFVADIGTVDPQTIIEGVENILDNEFKIRERIHNRVLKLKEDAYSYAKADWRA